MQVETNLSCKIFILRIQFKLILFYRVQYNDEFFYLGKSGLNVKFCCFGWNFASEFKCHATKFPSELFVVHQLFITINLSFIQKWRTVRFRHRKISSPTHRKKLISNKFGFTDLMVISNYKFKFHHNYRATNWPSTSSKHFNLHRSRTIS